MTCVLILFQSDLGHGSHWLCITSNTTDPTVTGRQYSLNRLGHGSLNRLGHWSAESFTESTRSLECPAGRGQPEWPCTSHDPAQLGPTEAAAGRFSDLVSRLAGSHRGTAVEAVSPRRSGLGADSVTRSAEPRRVCKSESRYKFTVPGCPEAPRAGGRRHHCRQCRASHWRGVSGHMGSSEPARPKYNFSATDGPWCSKN
jgi:hypothetical protein